ncbi:hypothetical protein EKH79_03880 [Dyella dinghuensis]|uniref:Uncharacterized protein n=1 Tax=Dyella dinghuensis TaxID=1920169 RepID=A0A3S0RUG5_9GAMM|nr:hypothetical protein [Dyella dinghuensis]RUL65857.1 hypothetical protein EKH79_03880 [Dyella dinghuensis]
MSNNNRNLDAFSIEYADLVMAGTDNPSTIDAHELASLRDAYERMRGGGKLTSQSQAEVFGSILSTVHKYLSDANAMLGDKLDMIAAPVNVEQLRNALLDANALLAALRCDVARIFATATVYAAIKSD